MNLNLNKALSQIFAPISNVVWDIMSNKTGIKTESGIYTLGDDKTIELNPFDAFSAELPAFAQLTPVDQVNVGDVIVSAGKPTGWIVGKKEASLVALNMQGHETIFRPKKVSMMGVNNGITVVRSPFDPAASATQPGSMGGMGSMNPMLLAMMMGDNKKLDPMMLALMMGGMGGGQMNPMVMLAMMGDNSPFKKGA